MNAYRVVTFVQTPSDKNKKQRISRLASLDEICKEAGALRAFEDEDTTQNGRAVESLYLLGEWLVRNSVSTRHGAKYSLVKTQIMYPLGREPVDLRLSFTRAYGHGPIDAYVTSASVQKDLQRQRDVPDRSHCFSE